MVTRKAKVDTILPLGTPVLGRMMDHVRLRKGTSILLRRCHYVLYSIPRPQADSGSLALLNINISPTYFGPDAETFNPERFLDSSVGLNHALPGPYGGIMTFGAGHRACM